jgi:branched-chain amino acid aminotransferase
MRERAIPIQEFADAHAAGRVNEVFCTGTAAVISPIGELKWRDRVMNFNGGKIGPVTQKLYDEITGMQTGAVPDKFGWLYKVS